MPALRVEQTLFLAQQLEPSADAAPDGHVLARVEALAVPAVRELARRAVEAALPAQAEAAEKKGAGTHRRLRTAPGRKGHAERNVLTAAGDVAFQTDGTRVNTGEGWREMRLGIDARRARGRPATAAAWDTRRLPPPHARVLLGGIETAERFGPRMRRWGARRGVRDASEVSVLADGADWIGKQTRGQLPGAKPLLDVFHGSEHRSDCARVLYGEGAAQAFAWGDAGRQTLRAAGAAGVRAHLATGRAEAWSAAKRAAFSDAAGSFERRADALAYAERLAQGQSIGSGLGEGACKQGIGRRRKPTGARRRRRRANRRATRGGAFHGGAGTPYGQNRLNRLPESALAPVIIEESSLLLPPA